MWEEAVPCGSRARLTVFGWGRVTQVDAREPLRQPYPAGSLACSRAFRNTTLRHWEYLIHPPLAARPCAPTFPAPPQFRACLSSSCRTDAAPEIGRKVRYLTPSTSVSKRPQPTVEDEVRKTDS